MDDPYSYPWVMFSLKKELYAVATPYVRTMVAIPEVTEIPKSPAYIRGAINLRGQVSPLIDLRKRLDMDSSLDHIKNQVEMLKQREQDHLNWLAELEASVNEDREFTLATDHHKCKFGIWYDSYIPKSHEEKQFLRKFDLPHQRIHQIAIHVKELLSENKREQALQLIESTREGELAEMINLFAKFIEIINKQANSEIAILMKHNSSRLAIAVDSIITVEKLKPESIEPMPELDKVENHSITPFVAKTGKENSIVYLLDANALFTEAHTKE